MEDILKSSEAYNHSMQGGDKSGQHCRTEGVAQNADGVTRAERVNEAWLDDHCQAKQETEQ